MYYITIFTETDLRRASARVVVFVLVAVGVLGRIAIAAPPAPAPYAAGRVERQSLETPTPQPSAKQPAIKRAQPAKTPIGAKSAGAPAGAVSTPSAGGGSSFVAVMSSLAMVIGLLLLVMWLMRRALPAGSRKLPPEVMDVLGHASLGNRQQAQLVRLGNKLLLVAVSATGAETLGEVTDPDEVERLSTLARKPAAPVTPAATFRQILQQFERKPAVEASTAKRSHINLAPPIVGEERSRG